MARKHVVVDGSNIATEGRSLPSLRQLDEAVREFVAEHPHDRVTVVVDATFGHRIAPAERAPYEEAVANGELITPPAGAIGRGDAFVLQIADRAKATVLSNDSFQEFHGTYPWLFDEGRLIGGKPVPDVGWIFVLRAPVRGPASRRSVRAAKKEAPAAEPATESVSDTTGKPAIPTTPVAKAARATKAAAKAAAKAVEHAHPTGTHPAPEPSGRTASRSRRRRGGGGDASGEPQNDLSTFIDFVAAHPVGSIVEGVVERFSSHGAYVLCDGAQCYIALRSLGDPPPRSAREVLTLGASRAFVVQSIDAPRRGIDLALGETRLEKTDSGTQAAEAAATAAGRASNQAHAEEARVAPAAKKAPARKAAAKKTAAKKAPARKTAAKKAPAKRATARKTAAKKAPAKKAAARKTTAKKTTAKRAPARKTAAKKTTAKRAPARKAAKKK